MMSVLSYASGPCMPRRESESLLIALVNNMPDAALHYTERQYKKLFTAASPDIAVRLLLFSLPELSRSEAVQAQLHQYYYDFATLWDTPLDGLIVTGMPPRAARLEDEPYWRSLTRLIEWAQQHTVSTVWSCLAAHAAVLHLDGVGRRALPEKLFGLYECVKAADHPILSGTPARWRVPHSRYNDLPQEALVAAGYRMLSISATAGADMFCKEGGSLFLFLQGHPEYDAGALLREYRRDVAAYLARRSDHYPRMPRVYFDKSEAAGLSAFRRKALAHRYPDLIESFPVSAKEATCARAWRCLAMRLYANWLSHLAERRSLRRVAALPVAAAARSALAPAEATHERATSAGDGTWR
jgi:homoserine O-succinyltransferase/O-acetyltransferase